MSLLLSVRKRMFLSAIFAAFPGILSGQIAVPQGPETAIVGALAGDQVRPNLTLDQSGGYLVWEENGSKKTGMQIKAARLGASLQTISTFTVNKITTGDQINPQVQLLSGGNAIFVWQNYGKANADIYARVVRENGSFATSDIRVNSLVKKKGSYSDDQQSQPVICALQDGSALIVWQSFGQDGSMFGIYAARISPEGKVAVLGEPDAANGTKKKPFVPNEFQVNQTWRFNQRSPAVATLKNGNVVILWISELQRFGSAVAGDSPSVDVYARLFDSNLKPVSGEILINSANNICANPSVAPLPDGGFSVAWSEMDALNASNSWDIVGRSFSADGVPADASFTINTHTYGDQYRPKIATVGEDCVVIWTSLGQDGSREGVFGRVLSGGTQPVEDEFRVNTTTISRQRYPDVAADGGNGFLAVWAGFVAGTSFDLFSQKYSLTHSATNQ